MKYSEIKSTRAFCSSLHSEPDWREVVVNIGENDFTVDNVRFIRADAIDGIQADGLSGDEYALGCFNARFLADITGIDQDVFDAMQKAGAYEAVGKLVISMDKISELQQEYARLDGYGHHFNSYDFGEEEVTLGGIDYLVFDCR